MRWIGLPCDDAAKNPQITFRAYHMASSSSFLGISSFQLTLFQGGYNMHLVRIAVVSLCLGGSSTIGVAAESATKVITLGTRSGPNPTLHRAQTSNLLIVNGARYVIDAGDGVTRRLTRYGSTFSDI